MKALLLAGATLAAVACSTEPSAAVRVPVHKSSGEADPSSATTPASAEPTTTTTETPAPTVATTTTSEEPVATTAPRRSTTTAPYVEPASPQSRTTGRGSEPPAGDMPAVMDRIAGCESGSGPNSPGSYTAQNPRSSASGRYQFLDSTFQSLDASAGYSRAADAPPAVQDAAALELYRRSGTAPWNESRGCWA